MVAPYNAQVNALRAALPERVRVGTVDKFQGQEAPVCLVSMTASAIEEVPRGMGFLFSLNRINVAVSRAKALALVFASPRLLDAPLRYRRGGPPRQHPLRAAARRRAPRRRRMIRFLHTADLHLGKPFGRFPEDLRGRLREARHASIARLAAAARASGAADILVAGDSFDAETPSPGTLHQALNAMKDDPGLRWWLLPGNHDSLAASALWERIAREAPANVRPLLSTAPVEMAPGAFLLPAPVTHRRPGRDLTAGMAAVATPAGALRIGLAHGAVQAFSEEGNPALIAPDRAETAGLGLLALGDWHGQLRIGERTWYAGTPEADGFKHDGAPGALVVRFAGTTPEVTPVAIGALAWRSARLDLLPGDDPAARLCALLPAVAARRDTLLRVTATGRTGLAGEAALARAVAVVEHDFAWLGADQAGLAVDHAPADLEVFGLPGTALRTAADALRAEADDAALPGEARQAALTALSRLYALAGEAA